MTFSVELFWSVTETQQPKEKTADAAPAGGHWGVGDAARVAFLCTLMADGVSQAKSQALSWPLISPLWRRHNNTG